MRKNVYNGKQEALLHFFHTTVAKFSEKGITKGGKSDIRKWANWLKSSIKTSTLLCNNNSSF